MEKMIKNNTSTVVLCHLNGPRFLNMSISKFPSVALNIVRKVSNGVPKYGSFTHSSSAVSNCNEQNFWPFNNPNKVTANPDKTITNINANHARSPTISVSIMVNFPKSSTTVTYLKIPHDKNMPDTHKAHSAMYSKLSLLSTLT